MDYVLETSGRRHVLVANRFRELVNEHIFTPSYWMARDALGDPLGGRGSAWRIQDSLQGETIDWVLRNYLRGGMVRHLVHDRYFFSGLEKTRPWCEFMLLLEMRDQGLPVPEVVAARIDRGALSYRGSLITATLPGESLTARVLAGKLADPVWQAVGRTIARFHQAGIWHADLNANNILLDLSASEPDIHLIDFDRARRRDIKPDWQQANLDRLLRSLEKETRDEPSAAARVTTGWAMLKKGYSGQG
ncbi:MAG: 3-deoxy-D-manno-octulosonic acid kinase [Gammaproteobacteria bacterium]|nr:3-deoxy-D-manno-octulosonic acid kinase [Gammaproteobacteria bacterium]